MSYFFLKIVKQIKLLAYWLKFDDVQFDWNIACFRHMTINVFDSKFRSRLSTVFSLHFLLKFRMTVFLIKCRVSTNLKSAKIWSHIYINLSTRPDPKTSIFMKFNFLSWKAKIWNCECNWNSPFTWFCLYSFFYFVSRQKSAALHSDIISFKDFTMMA